MAVRIGVFSKFECAGGSEFRCAEMANGISQVPGHQALLLAETKCDARVRKTVLPAVDVVEGVFSAAQLDALYSVDYLLVVNTDAKEFTRADYWLGRTSRHQCAVDLRRLPGMAFLFNFIVSPSRHLPSIREQVRDVRIVTANQKFFAEISEQDRYEAVRHYPRLCLDSPIRPESVTAHKSPSTTIRFGAHSKSADGKWNLELQELIAGLNARHGDAIAWDFMGVSRATRQRLAEVGNVRLRPEFAVTVQDFLQGLDVFVYFPSWKREEPWARAVAEALTSGCPVVTTHKGGNRDQVVHGNNGFLCRTTQEFVECCDRLVRESDLRTAMRRNALAHARRFSSQEVTQRFLDFLTW